MKEIGLPARRAAMDVLLAVRQGEPFDAALARALTSLPDADKRLAHELAAGVLRRQSDLDARLIPLVRHGWGNVEPSLREVLRLGAYQLVALDRVPTHAAVSTAVDLARSVGGSKAAGFVNALLRNLGGRAAAPSLAIDPAAHFAALYSHPDWLVARWLERYGQDDTVTLMEWNNMPPSLVLQAAREDDAQLETRWRAAGMEPERAAFAGWLSPARKPAEVPGFAEGAFIVQDPAHALVAAFAGVEPGMRVYDACAAPGGKSIALGRSAAMVVSADLKLDRVRRLAENLARAGRGRERAVVADALHPPVASADVVLLDAPCLGTGTFARHPDARWKVSADALARLARRQGELLQACADVVRPGGWLVYATCSLEPEENEHQVEALLARDPRFERDPGDAVPAETRTARGDLQLLPFRHGTDGAYAARLRRRA
jgi:16S rRNA (cytosine967-C5)-methyltransferase